MEYSVILSESALEDLDAILSYMSQKLDSHEAAACFADDMEEKLQMLACHPNMFSLSPNRRLAERGYRRVVLHNYILECRVEEAKSQVFVACLFYGKREYEKYL